MVVTISFLFHVKAHPKGPEEFRDQSGEDAILLWDRLPPRVCYPLLPSLVAKSGIHQAALGVALAGKNVQLAFHDLGARFVQRRRHSFHPPPPLLPPSLPGRTGIK